MHLKNILFVENDQTVAKPLKEIMECLGHKVTFSSQSQEALKLFKAYPNLFKLIISEYHLPDMDGIQFKKNIHSIKPNIPVVITTGDSSMISDETIKNAGIKEILPKPSTLNELKTIIEKALSENKTTISEI